VEDEADDGGSEEREAQELDAASRHSLRHCLGGGETAGRVTEEEIAERSRCGLVFLEAEETQKTDEDEVNVKKQPVVSIDRDQGSGWA
jgi:hypothetical protein